MTREERRHLDNIERTEERRLRHARLRVLDLQENELKSIQNRHGFFTTFLALAYLVVLSISQFCR